MPFDGSGNYSRVHDWTDDRDAGIKIRADRMDEEFDDLAASLNVVFFRNGLVPMSGDLDLGSNDLKGVATGTAVAPSIQFASDPNTGIYLNGAGKVGIAANGVQRFEVDTAGAEVFGTFDASGVGTFASDVSVGGTFDVTGATTLSSTLAVTGVLSANGGINVLGGVLIPDGSQIAPTIAFSDDADTGIFSPFADAIAFTTGGSEAMRINSVGHVGIGAIPTVALDVAGAGAFTGNVTVGGTFDVTGVLTGGVGAFTSLTVGGSAVLTAASTIDADTLDGFDSSVFPRLGTANSFSQIQSFGNGVEMDRASGDAYILWKNATVSVAQQRVTSAGKLRFTDAAAALDMFSVDQSGNGYLRNSLGIGTLPSLTALDVLDTGSGTKDVALFASDGGADSDEARIYLSANNSITRGTYISGVNTEGAGATNQHSLTFGTSQGANSPAERMRINHNGLCAIGGGGFDPQYRLHVINSRGEGDPSNAFGETARFQNNANSAANTAISIIGGTAASSILALGDANDADVGRLQYDHSANAMAFYVNASERMRIDSAGELGIGTTNPVDVVHAVGGNSLGFRYVSSGGVTAVFGDIAGVGARVGTTSAHDFRIVAGGAGEVARFQQSSGNVGIGITNPTAKLQVAGNIQSTTGQVFDSIGDVRKIIKSGTTSGALGASQAGQLIRATGSVTLTDDVFAANDTLMIVNKSGGDITITEDTNLTLTDSDGNTGNRTLANHGVCTVWFNAQNDAIIFGTGLS